jgi:hypothetical protein
MRKKRLSILVLFILMASTLVGCPPGRVTPSTITTLSTAVGDVSVKASTGTWTGAHQGMSLVPGDSIETGDNSLAKITFWEGSTIELQSDTQIQIVALAISGTGSTTIKLKQAIGTTISRVTNLVDSASRYDVETAAGAAAVIGSVMQVYVIQDGTTWITNLEGNIWAIAQGVELEIPQGRQCIIRPSQPPELTPELIIRTWYDLNVIRNNLGGNYTLMNNLDSTTAGYNELASPSANGGGGWQPIGNSTIGNFNGTFKGQGYEIKDLFIGCSCDYSGLFGSVNGTIEDIGVVNANVTGFTDAAGGLVGWNNGTVSNSYSTGSVSGHYNVGGLVGWNNGTVSNSYSTGNVTGSMEVGGLVGLNYHGTVSNSYSTGNVTGSMDVGGLVGSNYGTVSNSFWDTETSGQPTSDGGTGNTTAEMQNVTTFSDASWDIIAVADPGTRNTSYIWNIVNNVTYPFLSWQP